MGYFKFSSIYLDGRNFFTQTITDAGFLHSHDFYEFSYVVKGKVKHKTSETDFSYLTNSTLVAIKPNTIHAFDEENSNESYHRDIIISKNYFKKICDSISPDAFNSVLSLSAISFINLNKHTFDFFEHHLSYFNTAQKIDNTVANSIKLIITSALINLLLTNTNSPTKSASSEIYNKLILSMNLPSVLEGGLPVLIKEMNYSQVHLNRIAHEYEDKNIFAILTRHRMQYAARLLKTTDLTINKIAALVGYNSISHFSDAFKKETGFSPSKYKANELLNHTKAGMFGPKEI